jgi:hypothetical protein
MGASKEMIVMKPKLLAVTSGALALCLAGLLTTSGCIGQTSKEWLLGTLGQPTRVTQTSEGTEIMTYEYTKKIDSDFEVFLLLDMKDKREERTVYTFELTDGIVTEYWKD